MQSTARLLCRHAWNREAFFREDIPESKSDCVPFSVRTSLRVSPTVLLRFCAFSRAALPESETDCVPFPVRRFLIVSQTVLLPCPQAPPYIAIHGKVGINLEHQCVLVGVAQGLGCVPSLLKSFNRAT